MILINARKNISKSDFLNCYFKEFVKPIKYFFEYRKVYRNYYQVIKRKMTNDYPIKAILKNGRHVILKNLFQVRMFVWEAEDFCTFQKDLLIINLKGSPPTKLYGWEESGDLSSIFFDNEYGSLPVKDNVVIDIGANIADSSIYFALHGAKNVIALEPAPKNYEFAKKNIQLNGLTEKIELLMAGISDKRGHKRIDCEKHGIFFSLGENNETGIDVTLLTLDDLVTMTKTSSCVLKMDCEGCEYESVISASNETLRNFSHIQIEYHFGYKNLKTKLEKCGFKVWVTKPEIGHRLTSENLKSYCGYLFAEKIS